VIHLALFTATKFGLVALQVVPRAGKRSQLVLAHELHASVAPSVREEQKEAKRAQRVSLHVGPGRQGMEQVRLEFDLATVAIDHNAPPVAKAAVFEDVDRVGTRLDPREDPAGDR